MTLRCESTIDPNSLPKLPVFGNSANSWVVAAKGTNRSIEQTTELVQRIWVSWSTLFPQGSSTSVPLVFRSVTAHPIDTPDPPLQVAGTADVFTVRFNYNGPDAQIRWPTWVQRRRERIDPLCPLTEVDATVAAVAAPEILDPGRPQFEAPRLRDDPLDLGLGPVKPPSFPTVVTVGALVVGGFALAVLLSRGVKQSR